MNPWLRLILSLSLSGGVLAAVLLAVTRLFGSRLGRRWQYYIWLLVVLRMVLPVAAPVNLGGALFAEPADLGGTLFAEPADLNRALLAASADSDGALFAAPGNSAEVFSSGEPAAALTADEESLPADRTTVPEDAARPQLTVSRRPAAVLRQLAAALWQPVAAVWQCAWAAWRPVASACRPVTDAMRFPAAFWQFVTAVWFLAAVWLLGRKIWSYGRAVRLLQANGTGAAGAEAFSGPFEAACNTCGLQKKPKLIVSRAVPVPVAFGILHPAVAVPADFPQDKAYYAFLHELTHIRRCDALYKWAVEIVVCLHFFNPMVYVLRRETARTCELSCDETVIRELAGADKQAYGDMLLATLRHGMPPACAAMTLSLGENARWMKERLGVIMKFRKKSRVCMIFTFALTTLLTAGALLCGFAPVQKSGNTVRTDGKIKWDSSDILRRSDQKGYQAVMSWENGYIVALAWNVDSSRYGTVRQTGGKTVCYADKVKKYADDAAVTEALRLAIAEREGKNGFQGNFPMEEPVLIGVDGPFEGTPDDLLPQFYKEGNVEYFAAVIGKAETKTVETMAMSAVQDGQTDFFAITAGYLPVSALSQYAEAAYDGNNIDIFVIAAGELPDQDAKDLARRAVKDGKSEFLVIVMGALTDEETAQLALDAYEADDIELFYLTCNKISAQQADQIGVKAYEDDRIDYMYAVGHKMTDAQRSELGKRAKKEGKTEFWYALIG